MSIEQIRQEVLALPPDGRLQLVNDLLASLEQEIDETTQSLWLVEAKRRRDEILNGTVQVIEGETALAQVRLILD